MKSILFIGWYPNPVEKYKNVFFQNLVYEMARQGNSCTVISPVSYMKYREKIREIPVYFEDCLERNVIVYTYYPRTISASSIKIGSFNTEHISEECFERTALDCAKTLKRRFDCVYGHFFLYGGLAAVRVGRALAVPSFIAYGECDFESQVYQTFGMPKKYQLEGLSGIVSVSSKNTKELCDLKIAPDVPVITEPNAVDGEMFYKKDRAACRARLGLPQDRFIVGFVGGFIERKGDKRLLKATETLDDVYLAFAGCGDKPPRGEKTLFCKALEHQDICIFLNAIDVFCLPTLSEGSSNAVAEAMACGCAIISSALPFNDDILTDDNAIRIDPSSIEEIRSAIILLKENDDIRRAIADKALKDSEKHTMSNRAKRILDFIEEVCELS